MARGSCYECVAILQIAKERELVTPTEYETLYNHCVVIKNTYFFA